MTIANSARLDPVEHMLARQGIDRNERAIRRAQGSEAAKDFAIQFHRMTKNPVTNAAGSIAAAQQLHEACRGDWSIAVEAFKRLRSGPNKLTISSPRSLIHTAAAIRGERDTQAANAPAPAIYVPQFN